SPVNFMSQRMSKRQPLFNPHFTQRSDAPAPIGSTMSTTCVDRGLKVAKVWRKYDGLRDFSDDIGSGNAFSPCLWFTNANRYITNQRQEPRCLRNESRRARPISSIARSSEHEPPAVRRSSEDRRKEKRGNGEHSPMTGLVRQQFRTQSTA